MPELSVADTQEPKNNRSEVLENRIGKPLNIYATIIADFPIAELEALLKEKDQALSANQSHTGSVDDFFGSSLLSGLSDNFGFHDGSQVPASPFPSSALDELAGVASLIGSSFDPISNHFGPQHTPTYPKSWGLDIGDPSWPRNLPNVVVLRQL